MRAEETYSYKTSSSKLVRVAEIASRYKGRPEMLMKVIIQVQKIVPAFSASVASELPGKWEFHRRMCIVLSRFMRCFR